MSKPKHGWWSWVKGMCHRWPELEVIHKTKLEQQEYESVRRAMEETAPERLEVLRLCLIGGTGTIQDSAEMRGVPTATVKQWQREFIYRVAAHFGLLD